MATVRKNSIWPDCIEVEFTLEEQALIRSAKAAANGSGELRVYSEEVLDASDPETWTMNLEGFFIEFRKGYNRYMPVVKSE